MSSERGPLDDLLEPYVEGWPEDEPRPATVHVAQAREEIRARLDSLAPARAFVETQETVMRRMGSGSWTAEALMAANNERVVRISADVVAAERARRIEAERIATVVKAKLDKRDKFWEDITRDAIKVVVGAGVLGALGILVALLRLVWK